MKTKTVPNPQTDAASCAKYGSRAWECNCPDRVNRGGSHFDERTHEKVCKHMLAIRLGQVDSNAVRCIERGMTPEQLTAEAAQLCRQMGTGKDIIPAVTVTPAAPAAKAAESLAALRSRRADLEARLEEVSYQIDMAQPVDEEEAAQTDYFQIGYMMNDMDNIMGELEDLDRKIARAIQAEDMASKPEPKATPATIVTCASHSGIKMSATESLLAAISPQLQGSPIRRHG